MIMDNGKEQLINGKIAEIEDQYTVIINKGFEDGVKERMRFIIYKQGKEIFDPDSKASLGYLEHVKAKVKITQVSAKHSIARSDETETMIFNQFESIIPDLLGTKTKVLTKELPVDASKLSEPEATRKHNIDIGDFVRQIPD